MPSQGCSDRSRQSPAHHKRLLSQVCCPLSMQSAACMESPQQSLKADFNLASRVWPACSYFGCGACAGVPTVDDRFAHGKQEGLSCPDGGLVPTALQR